MQSVRISTDFLSATEEVSINILVLESLAGIKSATLEATASM
jgi:hypothetical protein